MLVAGAVSSTFAVDPPIVQDANFRANQSYFSYVDSQIRGLETHVVQSLVSGLNATWVRVDNSSAAVVAGTVVCLAGSTAGTVTVATTATLAAAGMALGVCLQAAPSGGLVPIALSGKIPPSISGLPTTGNNLYARVNVSTGAIQTVSSLGGSDYILGTVDAAGNLTLTPQLGATALGAGGGGGGITFANDLAGSTPTAQWLAAISGPGGVGTAQLPVHTVGFQYDASQTTPTYSQATQTSNAASNNLVFAPQGPFSSSWAPGSFVIALAAPLGSGNGGLIVTEGAETILRTSNIAGVTNTTFLWLGHLAAAGTAATSNCAIAVDNGDDLLLQAPGSAGTVNISMGTPANGANIQITFGQSNTVGSLIFYGGAPGWNVANYAPTYIEWTPNPAGVYQFAVGEVPTTTRYFSALNPNLDITTTQIPSGSGVTYFGNAITNPTSAPVGGPLLYGKSGQLWVYQTDGTNFQIQVAGGGGGVSWAVDLVNSSNSAQYVSGLSSSASGGAVTLASNAWIAVSTNTTIIQQGSNVVLALDAGNNLRLGRTLNSVAGIIGSITGGVAVFSFTATSTDFVAFGATPAASGNVRFANSSGFVAARNAANTADITVLSTDANNNVTLGGSNAKGVLMFSGATTVARLQALTGTDFVQFGATSALSGYVRADNNTTIATARNAANTGDITILASSSANQVILGSSSFATVVNGSAVFLDVTGTAVVNLQQASTDFVKLGVNPAASGYFRGPSAAGIVKGRNNGNTDDIYMLGLNVSDDIVLGQSGQTGHVQFQQLMDYEAAGGTAASASTGSNGDVPAQVAGYIVLKIAGSTQKIPYYN